MQFDRFLTLLDGTVEIAFTERFARLVSNGIERYEFGVVIPVSVLFFQRAFDIGYRTIVIGIVSRIERMPPTAFGGILLGRTGRDNQRNGYPDK